jgi:hypothetical protein
MNCKFESKNLFIFICKKGKERERDNIFKGNYIFHHLYIGISF